MWSSPKIMDTNQIDRIVSLVRFLDSESNHLEKFLGIGFRVSCGGVSDCRRFQCNRRFEGVLRLSCRNSNPSERFPALD